MSIFSYGPKHAWFAWHPVRTEYHGWKWLCVLNRWRTFADSHGAPVSGWWSYAPRTKECGCK